MVVWLEIETLVIDKCGTRRGADGKVGVGRVIWAARFCVLCVCFSVFPLLQWRVLFFRHCRGLGVCTVDTVR
jgi:hypothetical protein